MTKSHQKHSLMSRAEAAAYLGISPRTLSRRTQEGRLPYYSSCSGGKTMFRQSDLDNFISKNIRRKIR